MLSGSDILYWFIGTGQNESRLESAFDFSEKEAEKSEDEEFLDKDEEKSDDGMLEDSNEEVEKFLKENADLLKKLSVEETETKEDDSLTESDDPDEN